MRVPLVILCTKTWALLKRQFPNVPRSCTEYTWAFRGLPYRHYGAYISMCIYIYIYTGRPHEPLGLLDGPGTKSGALKRPTASGFTSSRRRRGFPLDVSQGVYYGLASVLVLSSWGYTYHICIHTYIYTCMHTYASTHICIYNHIHMYIRMIADDVQQGSCNTS